jgi:hypothetical protein
MRALDQFWKFYTSFTDGIGHTRRAPEHERDESYARSRDDQRTAESKPAARGDGNYARQGGSHPAVWPR